MSENTLFSLGNVIKKEDLISVDFNTSCQSLVLESEQPYPGYHGITLPKSAPDSLYLVAKSAVSDDTIIRTIQEIKSEQTIQFDGAPGTIKLSNTFKASVIRIKNARYEEIPQLVQTFIDKGFEFRKYKKINSFISLINIRKYFKIKEIISNIYHDIENEAYYYLQIPKLIEWDNFEKITQYIKYNVEENNFDAALCSMYNENGLIDFVRIYDEKFKVEKLIFILKKYNDALKQL